MSLAAAATDVKAGRPSKAQARALGSHVVAVADALFVKNGYEATSMATVATHARVGKQTLYRRFPDKATLFREVIRRRIDALITPSDHLITQSPLAELKMLGRTALDAVSDPEFTCLYRIIVAKAPSFPDLASAASDHFGSSFVARCARAIRQAQAMDACRPGDAEALALCFLWSVMGDAFLKGLSGLNRPAGRRERDAHLELVWQVFLHGAAPD